MSREKYAPTYFTVGTSGRTRLAAAALTIDRH